MRPRRYAGRMFRPRLLRLCAVALWAVCLAGIGAGQRTDARTPAAAHAPLAGVSALQPTADSAVLPARAFEELRAATQPAPLRILLVLGVLAGLAGLLTNLLRRSLHADRGRRPLLARRHSISLRAPPSLRLA